MKLTNDPPRREYMVHVHFNSKIDDKTDFYFGSLSAIYQRFSAEQIGANLCKLWQMRAGHGYKVCTRTCFVERVEVLRLRRKETRT